MNLQIQHIAKKFHNGTKALIDVDFRVSQGEFVSVIGPSGAGKTTLFRILNGMMECTGGQKQRVAIARALMRHPAILLADEPVASLDPVTGRQILGLLKSIHATDGVTILMNSHNLEFSQEFSDRLIGLKDGKVVFDGKTADLTDSITTQIYNKNDTQIENKRGVAYE